MSKASRRYFEHCLILSLFCLSVASSPPSLLALNCSSPSSQKPPPLQLQSLSSNLTSQVAKTWFIALTNMMGFHRLVMQCRLDLSPARCTTCAQNAIRTVSTLCPYSNSGTAWFDACYLHYNHRFSLDNSLTITNNISCSSQIHVADTLDQFQVALERLFLMLRAEINLATRRRFSTGEIGYGNDSSKVYGLAECVRLMSPEECEGCVGEGVARLQKHCGGDIGGTVVAGNCAVRFESNQFFSSSVGGPAGGPEPGGGTGYGGTSETESVGGHGSMCFKAKVVLAWGVGVACLMGIVLFAWLMRRSVVNTAKVWTLSILISK